MARRSRQNQAVREFILANTEEHPDSVSSLAAKEFGLSRTAVGRYMQRLIAEGLITGTGKTNARRYSLKPIASAIFDIEISPGLSEDGVWRFRVLPEMKGVKQNVIDICQYGFTEMLNNVIDHSGSKDALISYDQTYTSIDMMVIDHGIGIFEKIQRDFNLPDPRSALLELSKGKLTSDRTRHSGEGIFMTSRMFNKFWIRSGNLCYMKERSDDGWLIETDDLVENTTGTVIQMKISKEADWTAKDIYDRFHEDGVYFRKTHVPIKLGKYPGEQLVSRSQAKRILSRFERFSEVFLDFEGVQQIGQPFADEIFRVFRNAHPDIKLLAIHTNSDIDRMIASVVAADEPQRVT